MQINLTRTRVFTIVLFSFLIAISGWMFIKKDSNFDMSKQRLQSIQHVRAQIRDQISPFIKKNEVTPHVYFEKFGAFEKTDVQYTFNPTLQNQANKLLRQYKPDYASIVAIDAKTGRVLALANYLKEDTTPGNLAIKATFPAASIFKIIPASVALDKYMLEANLLLPFNGSSHTLYRKNVMSDTINRWTRSISLKQAFAQSVNTFFARLALKKMQPDDLKEYAAKFQFNTPIVTDFPIDMSTAVIPNEKGYELAEVASGFNKTNTLSPVQGAMMAAAIADDGIMRNPYIVDSLTNEAGEMVYHGESVELARALTPEGAEKMRELMQATIIQGTSRKSFRPLVKNNQFVALELGGKTGSLTGDEPKGKVDWFVGYAIHGDQKIAIAAITVNKKYWTVKSAFLAQSIIKNHFKEDVAAR
ncbi:MAG: penicillin-binding transpeptidase domain-containing protein [Bdellovibrionota bacterium]